MSRPGNIASMCLRNFESMAMMSSKWPWMGQSLTIQIWPSRSMICALIPPTFSWTRMEGPMVGASRLLLRASTPHFGRGDRRRALADRLLDEDGGVDGRGVQNPVARLDDALRAQGIGGAGEA